jgi:hypothetical protein
LQNLHFPKYTLPLVYGQEITTRLFNGFIELVAYQLRFHRRCELCTDPGAPSCALWVPAITDLPTPSHDSAITASLNNPEVCYRSFPAQLVGMPRLASTTYYAISYPYRLMVVLFFMRVRSMNRSLDLGMITNHRLTTPHRTSALNHQHHTNKFHSCHPKSYSPH